MSVLISTLSSSIFRHLFVNPGLPVSFPHFRTTKIQGKKPDKFNPPHRFEYPCFSCEYKKLKKNFET